MVNVCYASELLYIPALLISFIQSINSGIVIIKGKDLLSKYSKIILNLCVSIVFYKRFLIISLFFSDSFDIVISSILKRFSIVSESILVKKNILILNFKFLN